jgi:hypothetical protein
MGDIWSRDLFNKTDGGAWHEDSKEHVITRMTDYSGIQIRDDPNDNATEAGEHRVFSDYESKMIRKLIFMEIILCISRL